MKFSDHHIQSPLAMIDRTCQVCHRESEETLRNNVYERQRKANEIRTRLEKELASAHIEAKFAWDKGSVALGFWSSFSWSCFPCTSGNSANPVAWTGQSTAGPSFSCPYSG